MVYLFLVLGVMLFILSIAYLDRYSVAFVGLIVSAVVIGLSGSTLQKSIDTQFKKGCVEQKGLIIEQQNGGLGCVNLSEIQYDKK